MADENLLIRKDSSQEKVAVKTLGEIGNLFVVVAMDPAGFLILTRRENHETVMKKHKVAPSTEAWIDSCGDMLITMHISMIAFDGIYQITRIG